MLYQILRLVMRLLALVFVRCTFVDRENFPRRPPYIMVSNHLSFFDAPILVALCPHTIHAIIAEEQRQNVVTRILLEIAGTIWLRRDTVDRSALNEAFGVLKRRRVLGIAPEGTRSRTASLQRGMPGAAYIASRSGALIVPVGLSGTEKIQESLPRFRGRRVRAAVGVPFRLPHNGRLRGSDLQANTDAIMEKIAELLPEEYRGVYRVSDAESADA